MIQRALSHMRALWPRYTFLPTLPFVGWTGYWLARGVFRWEHIVLFFVVPLLAYGNLATKRLFVGLFPMGLLGLVYDAMRYVKNAGLSEDDVHLCDLRAIEMRYFGIDVSGTRATVHDWFQAHPVTALDFICAIPYGTFIFAAIGFAIYLYTRDFPGLLRFSWSFLIVNLVGFVTYHVYPAAPPWYFHTHGCVVDLAAHASEGPALARVDAWLGVAYFHGMYGRSSDVFGAVPSLHVAYPSLIVLEGFRRFGLFGRIASLSFLGTMIFAAVYLDHHWIVDVILGLFYSVAVYAAVSRYFRWRAER